MGREGLILGGSLREEEVFGGGGCRRLDGSSLLVLFDETLVFFLRVWVINGQFLLLERFGRLNDSFNVSLSRYLLVFGIKILHKLLHDIVLFIHIFLYNCRI